MAKYTKVFSQQFLKKGLKLEAGKTEQWYRDSKSSNWYLRFRTGNKIDWFFRGTLGGKTIKRGLGSYPTVSEADARQLIHKCNECVQQGIDPRDYFNQQKNKNLMMSDDMYKFSTLMEDVIQHHTTLTDNKWSEPHVKRYRSIWNNYLAKDLKDKSILNTNHMELLTVLKKIKTNPIPLVSGKVDLQRYNRTTTTIYAKTLLNVIYQFAMEQREYAGDNPIDRIRKNSIFKKGEVKHHPSVEEKDLGMYWHKLKTELDMNELCAMIVFNLCALRVSSLVNAKWSWYDPTEKCLNIPKEYMKRKKKFRTPLPQLVIDHLNILLEVRKPKKDDYIWLEKRKKNGTGHMKDSRPLGIIKRYCPYATAHGVRTVLKLNLELSGKFNTLAINEQLHHKNKDKVAEAYLKNYDWFKERRPIVDYMVEFFEDNEKEYLAKLA